ITPVLLSAWFVPGTRQAHESLSTTSFTPSGSGNPANPSLRLEATGTADPSRAVSALAFAASASQPSDWGWVLGVEPSAAAPNVEGPGGEERSDPVLVGTSADDLSLVENAVKTTQWTDACHAFFIGPCDTANATLQAEAAPLPGLAQADGQGDGA